MLWDSGHRLPEPAVMTNAREEYRTSQNGLGEFAADRLRKAPGARTPSSEVIAEYVWWARAHSVNFNDRVKNSEFKDRMKSLGYESQRFTGGVFYLDCELVPEASISGIQSSRMPERSVASDGHM